MNCPLLREETSELVFGNGAVIEEHVKNCAPCAAFRAEQAAVWQMLDSWQPVPVSTDFNRRLWQRIDAAPEMPWYSRLAETLRSGLWKPAIPLAAAMVLVSAGFVYDHSAKHVGASTATLTAAVITASDADQVEQALDDIQLLQKFDSASGAI